MGISLASLIMPPNSSAISRFNPSTTVSPGSILPPTNPHEPLCLLPLRSKNKYLCVLRQYINAPALIKLTTSIRPRGRSRRNFWSIDCFAIYIEFRLLD